MIKLIFTDSHIEESSLSELNEVFSEIIQFKADELIFGGDYFEKKNPSVREILFGTKWAFKFKKKYKKVYFLKGNHDRMRGISTIDYLKYLGIDIIDNYNANDISVFHFMLYESKLEYGTGKCGIKDLERYNLVLLGHQHLFQELKNNKIYHLGSCRWCNFNEVQDKFKQIAIIQNNELEFIKLKSPIPMIDIHSVEELPNIKAKSKVRMVISSFAQFKNEINKINKVKNQFEDFKIKLDFEQITQSDEIIEKKPNKSLQDFLLEEIRKIEDKDVQIILEKEIKNGIR